MVRFRTGKSGSKSQLDLAIHANGGTRFELEIRTLYDRLFRTALILTKSPAAAERLLQKAFREARLSMGQANPDLPLGYWLSSVLLQTFSRSKTNTPSLR